MPDPRTDAETALRRLLVTLGAAMIATGQPVSEIEHELAEVSSRLGYPDVQIAAAATGITLNLASGEPSTYEAVRGQLRLDQAAEVRTVRHHLLTGSVSIQAATSELLALATRPPRYPEWLVNVGWVLIAVGIGLILQPGWANVACAAVGGCVVVALFRLGQRFHLVATLLPTLAAFVVACLVFAAADVGWLDGPLRTLLPPVAVLLPGALVVTAVSELAAGDMVAGSSRLVFGGVQLLLFTAGILAAVRLLRVPAAQLGNVRVDELGWWAAPAGLVLITVGVALLESPPVRLLPWIVLVLVLAFAAQAVGQRLAGPALGGFLGAAAASLGSYLVEAVKPTLPRLVLFQPAFWLLVPGSLGVLSTTALAVDPESALATVVGVIAVVGAISLGLLVGSAIAQSVRGLVRRTRSHLR